MPDDDTPEDAAFRRAARAWLEAHARLRATGGDEDGDPGVNGEGDAGWSRGPRAPTPEAARDYFERCRAWQRTLFDGGWAGITWPRVHGGREATPWQAIIFNQEQARFDVTSGFVGSTIDMVGPALMAHGTDAQQERFLRPLLRADEAWCQLFSEPGAGSDLANLSTRAERDGDEFVVNGQKVWTSSAQHCDWAILLARTDPDAPKHRGITFFLVDLRTPGIEIRPLRQLTGAAHFNEVFLTDVRIPAGNAVGPVDGGWAPARTVLAHEATSIGRGASPGNAAALLRLARTLRRDGDPVVRQRLARVYSDERVLGFMSDRVLSSIRREGRPAIDGSVLKVLWSEARTLRDDVAVDLLGPAGTLFGPSAPGQGYWHTQMLNRFWGSIGGGTNEVHRTMIGERVLGLPAEPRVDKHVPYRDLASQRMA